MFQPVGIRHCRSNLSYIPIAYTWDCEHIVVAYGDYAYGGVLALYSATVVTLCLLRLCYYVCTVLTLWCKDKQSHQSTELPSYMNEVCGRPTILHMAADGAMQDGRRSKGVGVSSLLSGTSNGQWCVISFRVEVRGNHTRLLARYIRVNHGCSIQRTAVAGKPQSVVII